MLKSKIKKIAIVFFSAIIIFQQFIIANAVVPSTVDYRVFLNGTKIFLSNKNPVDFKDGKEVYFTYTVEKMQQNCSQQGLLITADPTRKFPYTGGGFMRYQATEAPLMDEGCTYFIKITAASGGFRYDVTRAKDGNLEQIIFEKREGTNTDKAKYAGLWFDIGNLDARLKNVRCYDSDGKDLGIGKHCGSGTMDIIKQNLSLNEANDIDHRYEVIVDDKYNIAISNAKVPATSTVYLQYKVESAEYLFTQTGIALSNSPEREYPHGKGIIKFINYSEPTNSIDLLEVGAKYVIQIDRDKTDFTVMVQKTKGGKKDIFLISRPSGTYSSEFNFISLWYGTGEKRGTFRLTDLLFYDANRNNLGVQCNVDAKITHTGSLEDYAGCEAAYYCKENNEFIALYKDQSMKYTSKSFTKDAKYKVSKNVLTADFDGNIKKYGYLFKKITDEKGNVYNRLSTYKVTFVTGSETEIPVQTLSNKSGYQAMKPSDPILKGCKFEGWCTADKKAFDFDSVITKSITLYAKWSGDDGTVFVSNSSNGDFGGILSYILLGVSAAVLLSGIGICIMLFRKGLKYGNKK